MPTVSLVQPASSSTISGLAQLTATASADVTTVKFYIDGPQTMLGQATSSPWSIAVNTTAISNGTHTLIAMASNQSGNQTTSSPLSITVQNSGPPPPATLPANLNTNVWRFINPLGDASYATNGSELLLNVPAAANHDPAYGGNNNSVRVMQTIGNYDFLVELKFDSIPALQYQFEGLLVEQDAANYLRFQIGSTGNAVVINASTIINKVQNPLIGGVVSIPNGATALWIRVQRSGSTWTYTWSADGNTYNTVGSFTQPLTISAIGPFAGNYNSTASASPGLTARLDYFINKIPPAPGPPVSDTFNQ
jgi:hypothetical protein